MGQVDQSDGLVVGQKGRASFQDFKRKLERATVSSLLQIRAFLNHFSNKVSKLFTRTILLFKGFNSLTVR